MYQIVEFYPIITSPIKVELGAKYEELYKVGIKSYKGNIFLCLDKGSKYAISLVNLDPYESKANQF